QDGMGVRAPGALPDRDLSGAVRGPGARPGYRPDGRPNARRRARSNRDPWIGRSASSGRGRRAGGLVPHASRPAACERAGAAPAPALAARSAPDSGALPDAGAALRLQLTAAAMIGYAAGGGEVRTWSMAAGQPVITAPRPAGPQPRDDRQRAWPSPRSSSCWAAARLSM